LVLSFFAKKTLINDIFVVLSVKNFWMRRLFAIMGLDVFIVIIIFIIYNFFCYVVCYCVGSTLASGVECGSRLESLYSFVASASDDSVGLPS
jgi:hypothetical protein